MNSSSNEMSLLNQAYHIAIEIKSDKKGDKYAKINGAIESVATQICRGVGGMVEFLCDNPQILGEANEAYLVPVIFTTAKIWISGVELSSADLHSGNLDFNNTKFQSEDYVFYQYHLSPGLKHSHSPDSRPASIGKFMDSEYVRTIAVVSASGIEKFLLWASGINVGSW